MFIYFSMFLCTCSLFNIYISLLLTYPCSTVLSPNIDDIQNTINKAALAVLQSTKNVWQWDQSNLAEGVRYIYIYIYIYVYIYIIFNI